GPSSSSISRINISSLSFWFMMSTVLDVRRSARSPNRLELLQRLVHAGARALGRAFQRRANLFVFESPEFAHHQRLPLFVRQSRDRAPQVQHALVSAASRRGGGTMVGVGRVVAVAYHARPSEVVARAVAA